MNTDLKKLSNYLRLRYPAEISPKDAEERFTEEFIVAAKKCGLFSQSEYSLVEPGTGLEIYIEEGRMFVYDDDSEEGCERRYISKEALEMWRIDIGVLVILLGEKIGNGAEANRLDAEGLWDLGHTRVGTNTVHLLLSVLPSLHKHYSLLKNLDRTGVSSVFIISTEDTPFHPADVPEGIELLSLDEAFGVTRRKMIVNPDGRLFGRMNGLYQDVEMNKETGEVTLRKKSLGKLALRSAGFLMMQRLLESYGRVVSYKALYKYLIKNGVAEWKSKSFADRCHWIKSEELVKELGDTVNDFFDSGDTKDGEKGYKIVDLQE